MMILFICQSTSLLYELQAKAYSEEDSVMPSPGKIVTFAQELFLKLTKLL